MTKGAWIVSIAGLSLLMGACTQYQPLKWGEGVSWQAARKQNRAKEYSAFASLDPNHRQRLEQARQEGDTQTVAYDRSADTPAQTPQPVPANGPIDVWAPPAPSPQIDSQPLPPPDQPHRSGTISGAGDGDLGGPGLGGGAGGPFIGADEPTEKDLAAGAVHQVVAGETLEQVAQSYGLSVEAIAEANGLRPHEPLYSGQVLQLPAPEAEVATRGIGVGARSGERAQPNTDVHGQLDPSTETLPPPSLSGNGFLWPVEADPATLAAPSIEGWIANGITIPASQGTPILASENGVVIFEGDGIPAYGNMVVIRHDGDYTTAYGHLESTEVAVGDVVRRGQALGLAGATGLAAAAQLYFEMRVGAQVVDPVDYLTPSPRLASR
ncbi:MAG: peptidoglycan DD-metalloendopeptidase family protein [Geminicoccaceae bacterium]